jgi:hypothetical protein
LGGAAARGPDAYRVAEVKVFEAATHVLATDRLFLGGFSGPGLARAADLIPQTARFLEMTPALSENCFSPAFIHPAKVAAGDVNDDDRTGVAVGWIDGFGLQAVSDWH